MFVHAARTVIPVSIFHVLQWSKYSRDIDVARAQTGSDARRHALRAIAKELRL